MVAATAGGNKKSRVQKQRAFSSCDAAAWVKLQTADVKSETYKNTQPPCHANLRQEACVGVGLWRISL